MRRTATLSLFAEEKENSLDNVDHLFSINKKCKIELGIVNTVPKYTYQYKNAQDDNIKFNTINYQQLYGNIIWFPLGVFVMFNPSISHGIDGVSISMQLKDKMCLLNGDLGGQIHSSVDFAYQDQTVDADSTTLEKNPVLIYNIITQLVNHWGNEQLNKIIISEVPLQIKKVVRWMGNSNIYLVKEDDRGYSYTLKLEYPKGVDPKNVIEYEPGQDIGFIFDDFIYPGELVCNAGDSVTSVLDKIIGIMGNYQYFYDVFGNFIFRQKQNYLNMTNYAYWAKEQPDKIGNIPMDAYDADYYRLTKSVYDFSGNEYITAHNNTLNYNNLKNDFVVWGTRKSTSSQITSACRFHLAIDKKPQLNKHDIALYKDSNQVVRAVHYNKNTGTPAEGTLLFPDAIFEGAKGQVIRIIKDRVSKDWRQQIYYQMLEDEYTGTGTNSTYTGTVFTDEDIEIKNNTYFQYYAELKEEFPKIYNLENQEWRYEVGKDPENIDYFLDFIDEDSSLGGYSVSNIGRRAMIIGDNNEGINCVFEPQIPDLVYIDTSRYSSQELQELRIRLGSMSQRWTQIDSYLTPLFDIGGIYNSCFEKIKDLIYQYTHINNTISITGLPIYYLEPNTRITVEDKPGGIYGDYIIQSISLPLDISSTMTINAYQAEQKI